jgi:dynein heavy chain 2
LFFPLGINWVVQQGEMVVDTSLVGIVQNGLSQLHGVTNRAQFTVALIRGLGGNLTLPSREAFAKQVINSMYLLSQVSNMSNSMATSNIYL